MHVALFGPVGAPPVLLLHGGGVAGWMWRDLVNRLEQTHRVIVPDLPGHGASAAIGYRSHAETLSALAAALRAESDGRPAAVIGFSLGAQLAVLLATEHPSLVDAAVVVSAQAEAVPLTGATLALLRVSAPLARQRWFAKLQARELFIPPTLMADYIQTSAGITADTLVAAVGENMRFRTPVGWSQFPGRVLIMVGSRERGVMGRSAEALSAALPGSGLEVVQGCGHGIPVQRPVWFADHIADWLARA